MRILVTGATGLLGLNLCLSQVKRHTVIGVTHKVGLDNAPFPMLKCDLFSEKTFSTLLAREEIDWVVHCAAMANVDECEKHPQDAKRINTELPGLIANACSKAHVRLIHISTDAVFDGKMGDYSEEDTPNPLSVYAQTKLDGERLVAAKNPEALIARVNFYGYSLNGKRSLAEFFINNLANGRRVNGFVDVMFNPLYVIDLASILLQMADLKLSGLYHVVSPEKLSKYAFGIKIAQKFNFDASLIQPISVVDAGLSAVRSARLSLKIDRLTNAKIKPPVQNEGFEKLWMDFRMGLPDMIKSLARK